MLPLRLEDLVGGAHVLVQIGHLLLAHLGRYQTNIVTPSTIVGPFTPVESWFLFPVSKAGYDQLRYGLAVNFKSMF